MPDRLTESDMQRLDRAVTQSRRRIAEFGKHREEAVRQSVGTHYSPDGASHVVGFNLLELTVNVYARLLVAQCPQVLVTTRLRRHKPSANLLELAINTLLQQIRFEQTVEDVVKDALFSPMGIVKIGLGVYSEADVGGVLHDIGQPFADRVDLDDWVHDMRARRFEECAFMGNRYRLPLDYVKESSLYHKTGDLEATHRESVDEQGERRIEYISQGQEIDPDEYVPYIELEDLWLPLHEAVITRPVYSHPTRIIRQVEWEGPEAGPYRILAFDSVPNQIMALPPVATWMDIHDLTNQLFRKLRKQALRQKEITAYQGAARTDAERIQQASDGDMVQVDSVDAIKEIAFGGIDQRTLAFLIQLKQFHSWRAGNLDSLGGLAPQSETLGQDEMMERNASKGVQHKQKKTVNFVTDVVKDLGWYLWNDPLIELPMIKRQPGTDIEVPVTFSPETRDGEFFDYAIKIAPYSMQYQTPASKLYTIERIFSQYLIPLSQQMAAQGVGVNFEAFMKLVSKYADLPELEDLLTIQQPTQDWSQGGERMRQAAQTTRTNVRVNRPGKTGQGTDEALMQTLLGSGVQQSQAASMGLGG